MKVLRAFFRPLFFAVAGFFSLFTGVESGATAMYYMGRVELAISGKVIDAKTKAAIAGIRVSLLQGTNTNRVTDTAADGSFSFDLYSAAKGLYTLSADDRDGRTNGSYSNRALDLEVPGIPFRSNIEINLSRKTN